MKWLWPWKCVKVCWWAHPRIFIGAHLLVRNAVTVQICKSRIQIVRGESEMSAFEKPGERLSHGRFAGTSGPMRDSAPARRKHADGAPSGATGALALPLNVYARRNLPDTENGSCSPVSGMMRVSVLFFRTMCRLCVLPACCGYRCHQCHHCTLSSLLPQGNCKAYRQLRAVDSCCQLSCCALRWRRQGFWR